MLRDTRGSEKRVRVAISCPKRHSKPTENWSVRLRISGLGDRFATGRQVWGVDGMQATLLALFLARSVLESHPAYTAGRLYWLAPEMGHGLEGVPAPRAAVSMARLDLSRA